MSALGEGPRAAGIDTARMRPATDAVWLVDLPVVEVAV